MTRSRYFFNPSIIRQDFRQHGWIGMIYMLGLLFALPLQLFMSNDPSAEPREIENLFRISELQILFIISIPVVAGLFLFRYLQAKSSSDLSHSLPLRREHLLTAHLTSGLVLLLIPVWLTAGVVAIVHKWEGSMYIFQGAEIWSWCLTVTVITLFLFCFSAFVGICTGQTILQGIVTYILLILPAILLEMINRHLYMYLYGFSGMSLANSRSDSWSPIIRFTNLGGNPLDKVELWIYVALSAVFIGLSYLLYRKRNTEKAGQAIAFKYFNPLFKIGVMLCTVLIAGNYFAQMKQQQIGWVISGYVIGAIIGYVAAEMIIRKTWQILTRKMPAEFAIYAVLLGLLLYIPVSGLNGYEDRVPSSKNISGAYMGNNYWMYERDSRMYSDTPYTGINPFSEDKDYVEAVRKLHEAIVASKPEVPAHISYYDYNRYQSFTLAYQLENGRKLMRQYYVSRAEFEPELKAVMETESFKRDQYGLAMLDKKLDVFWISNRDKKVGITDPVEIAELKEIISREILNMSYEDQTNDKPDIASIETQIKLDDYSTYGYSYPWKSSFHELDKWLTDKGYADKVRTTAEDIKSAKIIKNDVMDTSGERNSRDNADQRFELARQNNRIGVTDDKEILTYILDYRWNYYGAKEGTYLVKLEYNNSGMDYFILNEADLTPELKALLK